jgi:hypothetical protein
MVDATVRTWFQKVQSLRFESFMAAVVHAAVDTTGDGERPYKAWFRSAAGSNSRPIHYPVKSRKRPINPRSSRVLNPAPSAQEALASGHSAQRAWRERQRARPGGTAGARSAANASSLTATRRLALASVAVGPDNPKCSARPGHFARFFWYKIASGRVRSLTPGPNGRWSIVPGRAPAAPMSTARSWRSCARLSHALVGAIARMPPDCFLLPRGYRVGTDFQALDRLPLARK